MVRAKSKFTLTDKERIAVEAYSIPNNVRKVAAKYGVVAANIRRWKKSFAKVKNVLSPKSYEEKINGRSTTFNMGAKAKHSDNDELLYESFKNIRHLNRVVTVRSLCAEYKCINEEKSPDQAIRQRIYRWMVRKNVVNRRVTHQAQNTRHCETIMKDWSR